MQRIIQVPFYHVVHCVSGLCSDNKQQDQFAIHKHVMFQEEDWKKWIYMMLYLKTAYFLFFSVSFLENSKGRKLQVQ